MKIAHASIAAALAVFAGPSFSISDTYFCETKHQVSVEESGRPVVRNLESPKAMPSINRFAVDRKTGKVIGGSFGSMNGQVETLVSAGNASSAFMITWTGPAGGGGVHLDLLRIEEFVAGPRKPFVGFVGGVIFTGICE